MERTTPGRLGVLMPRESKGLSYRQAKKKYPIGCLVRLERSSRSVIRHRSSLHLRAGVFGVRSVTGRVIGVTSKIDISLVKVSVERMNHDNSDIHLFILVPDSSGFLLDEWGTGCHWGRIVRVPVI